MMRTLRAGAVAARPTWPRLFGGPIVALAAMLATAPQARAQFTLDDLHGVWVVNVASVSNPRGETVGAFAQTTVIGPDRKDRMPMFIGGYVYTNPVVAGRRLTASVPVAVQPADKWSGNPSQAVVDAFYAMKPTIDLSAEFSADGRTLSGEWEEHWLWWEGDQLTRVEKFKRPFTMERVDFELAFVRETPDGVVPVDRFGYRESYRLQLALDRPVPTEQFGARVDAGIPGGHLSLRRVGDDDRVYRSRHVIRFVEPAGDPAIAYDGGSDGTLRMLLPPGAVVYGRLADRTRPAQAQARIVVVADAVCLAVPIGDPAPPDEEAVDDLDLGEFTLSEEEVAALDLETMQGFPEWWTPENTQQLLEQLPGELEKELGEAATEKAIELAIQRAARNTVAKMLAQGEARIFKQRLIRCGKSEAVAERMARRLATRVKDQYLYKPTMAQRLVPFKRGIDSFRKLLQSPRQWARGRAGAIITKGLGKLGSRAFAVVGLAQDLYTIGEACWLAYQAAGSAAGAREQARQYEEMHQSLERFRANLTEEQQRPLEELHRREQAFFEQFQKQQ